MQGQIPYEVSYHVSIDDCNDALSLKFLNVNDNNLLGAVDSACDFKGKLLLERQDVGDAWCLPTITVEVGYDCNLTNCDSWLFETSYWYRFNCDEDGYGYCWDKSADELRMSSSSIDLGSTSSSSSIDLGGGTASSSSSSIGGGGDTASSSSSSIGGGGDTASSSSSSIGGGGDTASSSSSSIGGGGDTASSSSSSIGGGGDTASSSSSSIGGGGDTASSSSSLDLDGISSSLEGIVSSSSSSVVGGGNDGGGNPSSKSTTKGTSGGKVTVIDSVDAVVSTTINGQATVVSTKVLSTRTTSQPGDSPSTGSNSVNGAIMIKNAFSSVLTMLLVILL
ncbi:uncharacterized protein KQ657_004509 [Scheffersomyces spartinae]|uniref:Uncharacterized protein n=1 Tax=Scheffersomyces spartinae TaxID=45513 RepID=A0A9P7VB97_9ASCO|nr:uncharacterized protein KQ657_004509 [Scheffersomyces spartinae]KAG7194828.1 hypothetical protein KQ657_004509 [Scheffersomyces spartinae]